MDRIFTIIGKNVLKGKMIYGKIVLIKRYKIYPIKGIAMILFNHIRKKEFYT